MSLSNTPTGERLHIGFFGMRNAGKSSLVNAVTGQALAVVSDIKGTTTDPVTKSMELLPLGPVVITDTPGLDDEGELGALRVEKAKQVLAKTDIAVLVVDSVLGISAQDAELLAELKKRNIPTVLAFNKSDLSPAPAAPQGVTAISVSAQTGTGINGLKEALGHLAKDAAVQRYIVSDMLSPEDIVVLVTPIDESAPKGRLILPQQLTLREILDANATAIVCQDSQLSQTLSALSKAPKMVITDSQVFGRVSKLVPANIPLTSFSILMARYKGQLETQIYGAARLSTLADGDKVLISEGCTHHRQCRDIGTVKIPGWIESFSGSKPEFHFTSGGEFPTDLSEYALVVHCGGCMLNEAEMTHRTNTAISAGVPIVNYGIAIAQMHGILKRSVELFPSVASLL